MGRGYVKNRQKSTRELATDAQVEAMKSKLAQRSKGSVAQRSEQAPVEREVAGSTPAGAATTLSEATQSPQAKSPIQLEWEKPIAGATAVKTKCGRYSCCKVTVMGRVSYELWKVVPGGEWFRPIDNNLTSFDRAKQLANEDANK